MMHSLRSTLFLLALTLTAGAAQAQVSLPSTNRRPPLIRHQKADKTVDYRVRIQPGVADVGAAATVTLSLSAKLKAHDARFGTRKPIDDATLTAYLVAPKTKAHGAWSAARAVLNTTDAGAYTMVFTSPVKGVHTLLIRGKSPTAGALEYSIPLSFGQWPLPEDVKLPAIPRRLPKALSADAAYGATLCKKYCKTTLGFASPKGAPPTYLDSSTVTKMTDTELLKATLGPQKAHSLTQTQRHHLLGHLHSLHYGVRDFFPKATRYMAQDFTINDYGLERLEDTARLELNPAQATATVIVAYKGGPATDHASFIPYDDRTARDGLSIGDKMGYVVLLKGPTAALHEVGMGLHLEPTYPIAKVLARTQGGATASSMLQKLRSFRGLGRFNDARSLRRGDKSLRSKLLPLYLKAAELATMYYGDEREFTAFDSEFADIE
jgi:hypothetical protein